MATCIRCCGNSNSNSSTEQRNHPAVSGGEEQVLERRYGCYRFGVFVAIIIIVILIVGSVPVFFAIDDTNLILIVTIVTLLIVGLLLLIYCVWQQRQAAKMTRKMSQRELEYLGRLS